MVRSVLPGQCSQCGSGVLKRLHFCCFILVKLVKQPFMRSCGVSLDIRDLQAVKRAGGSAAVSCGHAAST